MTIESKVEAIQQLKAYLKENGISKFEYIYQKSDGECHYCAVGYLMEVCGADVKGILLGNRDDNSMSVRHIESNSKIELLDPVYEKGFTFEELQRLQSYNDGGQFEELQFYLDSLLERTSQ